MARLPVTTSWPQDQISRRLAFLKQCIDRLGSSQMSKAHAQTQAAELALAVGSGKDGRDYLEKTFETLVKLPIPDLLPAPIALFGAILGKAKVCVAMDGLTIESRDWKTPALKTFPWTAPTPLLEKGIGALLAAALASKSVEGVPAVLGPFPEVPSDVPEEERRRMPEEERRRIEEEERRRVWQARRVMLLAANSPEAGILPAFGLRRNHDGMFQTGRPEPKEAWPTLLAREEEYAARIRLAQQEGRLFGIIRSVPLIDWPLLCLELALQRNVPASPPPETSEPSAKFIRELVNELGSATSIRSMA